MKPARLPVPCWECGSPSEHDHHVVPQSLGGRRKVPPLREVPREGARALRTGLDAHPDGRCDGAKARTGGAHRGVPYGMRLAADGVHLEQNPIEAAILERVRALRSDGLSLVKIAARLNEMGIPARGSRWHATTIARLLEREAA